jgi:UDP-N-acetylmuramoylalanine--D-glutamate ligase
VDAWSGRRVVVVGLARQGKALARYLAEQGARLVVTDLKAADELAAALEELRDLEMEFVLGGHPADLIEGADLVCLSGGVPADLPLARQARERGIPVSNDSQIFLGACPAPTIGITGSAGKTTTTALVGRMAGAHLAGSGRHAWVGGNIGRPLLAELPEIHPADWAVLELSSFQLELMTRSTTVAAVLNVTPNHLDRHKSMETYTAAKARILDFQDPAGVAVLGRDDPTAWALRGRARGRLMSFGWAKPSTGDGSYVEGDRIHLRNEGSDEEIIALSEVELRGRHNAMNVLAACAIAAAAGFGTEALRQGIRGFHGLPHRLEFVRSVRGAAWYDDSIATAPERALAALRAFDEPLVLLAGGRDKDLPWEELAAEICRRVRGLVLFGEAASKIRGAVDEACPGERRFALEVCPGLETAVQAAARLASPGDVVLLAPGGTSFDEFVDFEDRGDHFKRWVRQL